MEFPNGMAPVPPQMQPNNQSYPIQQPVQPTDNQYYQARQPIEPTAPLVRPVPVSRPATMPQQNPVQTYQQKVQPQPEVQVVRRNLTVAELLAVLVIAMIGVSTIQFAWNAIPKPQVQIEWKR